MLLSPRYVARFREAAGVLIRHGFADVLALLDLQRFLPGRFHRPPATPEEKLQARAKSLRLALEELGATYIKLGQLLSTRPDLLPYAFIEELERLQDRVEPFPFADVRRTVETELGRPLASVFASFAETPVASASLSQVHHATLVQAPAGAAPFRAVAVKVLRPGLEKEVELDLEILTEVAAFVGRSALGRRYDFVGIIDQLHRTLTEELDLRREARNTEHFRRALADLPRLRVPRVVAELTTARVFVAEYVDGQRIHEIASPVDPGVAAELWRGYLKEILVDGFFQCDPHPGNFLLDAAGHIVLLDHGMVAHLSRGTQFRLLGLLLALGEGDGERVAEACIEIGIAGPEFAARRFTSEIGLLVARHGGLEVGDLELGKVFVDLLRSAFKNDIQVPPELMLLGKTLLNLEGLVRRLDPAMRPVATMRETAASLLAQQVKSELTAHRALAATMELRALLTQVPSSVRRLLMRAANDEFRLALRLEGEQELQAAIQKIAGRITLGLITAALIVGSALVLNVHAAWTVWGYPVFALLGFLLAAGLGIYVVAKIILVDKY